MEGVRDTTECAICCIVESVFVQINWQQCHETLFLYLLSSSRDSLNFVPTLNVFSSVRLEVYFEILEIFQRMHWSSNCKWNHILYCSSCCLACLESSIKNSASAFIHICCGGVWFASLFLHHERQQCLRDTKWQPLLSGATGWHLSSVEQC